MNQSIVTLSCAVAVAIIYWTGAFLKHGKCELKNLVVAILNAIATVTGVFILAGAFKSAQASSQDAIWAGITGVCMTLYTLELIINSFKELFFQKVDPKKLEDPTGRK